jgi:2-dehydro-3-deoxygluconokinase
MALVRISEPGPLRAGAQAVISFGGAESNVAIGLRRLGVRTRWLSRVGDDPAGEAILAALRAEGVHAVVEVDASRPTGLMIKGSDGPSMTRVSYYRARSAASSLAADASTARHLDGIELVHATGITPALSDGAADLVRQVFALAHDRGISVSFDVNYRSALWDAETARRVLRPLLADVDLLFGGRDELELLCHRDGVDERCSDRDLLAGLMADGPREIILKRGARGGAVLAGEHWYEAPAHPILPVDTVGAGDAFVAGYLSAALSGAGPLARLHEANACGALVCLSPGDWEGLPTRRVLERFRSPSDPVAR